MVGALLETKQTYSYATYILIIIMCDKLDLVNTIFYKLWCDCRFPLVV